MENEKPSATKRLAKAKHLALGEKIGVITIGLAVAIMAAVGLKSCYQRTKAIGPYRHEISGKILDKFTKTSETEQGTFYSRRLLIEEKNGNLIRLPVSEAVWQEAQIGQWFIRDAHGVRFSVLKPRPPVDFPPSPNAMHTPET